MKTMSVLFIIITSVILTIGLDSAKLLTSSHFTPDPKLHWQLSSLDEIPANVSAIVSETINKTKVKINEFEKFKVAYYLIPESHFDLLYSIKKHKFLIERMKKKISGESYVRFFLHPSNIHLYQNLATSYRLIDQKDSQYMATAHKNLESLIVWNEKAPREEFFLLNKINNRNISSFENNDKEDDAISIIFSNGPHKLSGQEIISLPQ